jgi:hypothetical protein
MAGKLKTDRAARLEAELVVDRWNRRLATGRDMLWSPTIRARPGSRDALAGCLLSWMWDKPGDRPAHRGPTPTGLGRHAGARPAVLMVSGIGSWPRRAHRLRTTRCECTDDERKPPGPRELWGLRPQLVTHGEPRMSARPRGRPKPDAPGRGEAAWWVGHAMHGINGAFTKSSYVNHDLRCTGNPAHVAISNCSPPIRKRGKSPMGSARWNFGLDMGDWCFLLGGSVLGVLVLFLVP